MGMSPIVNEANLTSIERYGMDVRWGSVLRQSLGEGYWVVEEGLGGRTTPYDDPFAGEDRNGKRYLPSCLTSHQPINLVILMLGTNDLKAILPSPQRKLSEGQGSLVGIVQNSAAGANKAAPKILLICPPPISTLSNFANLFAGALEKSYQLADYYRKQADIYGCEFLDAGQIITSSDRDGIHFEASQHQALGLAVAERVRHCLAE